MRTVIIVVLLVLTLVPGWSGEERLALYDGTPRVVFSPVALDATDPRRTRLGALTYLGGIRLRSRDPAFGGFSSMSVRGDRFTLLGDGGLTFAFRMGNTLRPRDPVFGALPDGPGTGWRKRDRDGESMAVDAASGRIWVGFERANAIWRYAPGFARAEASARPRAMRGWSPNGGAEAMLRLADGSFLVFAESDRTRGQGDARSAILFDRDPTDAGARHFVFFYLPPAGTSPTDAARLPDGRLLLLNRAVSLAEGFTACLTVIDPRRVRPRARIRGQVVARFAAPVVHDNFEALAVTREGADTILWIASDDNAPSFFQRTLLLKFRL